MQNTNSVKKEKTDDYNALVFTMEKILLENERVPNGKHHRNLIDDFNYFSTSSSFLFKYSTITN